MQYTKAQQNLLHSHRTALPNNPMSAPEAPYVSIPDAAYSRVLLLKPTARIVFR